MPSAVVLGMQFGDEGKGRLCDYLAKDADIGARFTGGPNAGHTIYVNGHKYVTHLVPSTVLYPNKVSVITAGVAIDPTILRDEVEALGVDSVNNKLLIDHRCPVITANHKNADSVSNELAKKIGTTNRGVGPCFADQVSRRGKRYGDIVKTNRFDSSRYLYNALVQGKRVLFEGAQSTFLDLIHGHYPYVTSCSTTIGAVCTNAGIPPQMIDEVYGVFKAYCTRSAAGPFPTEDVGPMADFIREMGKEYGATTGRTRRIGWLDLVDLRRGCEINGVNWLVLTKSDILDEMASFPVATGRDKDGQPTYTEVDGWMTPLAQVKTAKDLPDKFKKFLDLIERKTRRPVTLVSIGPDRNQMIRR